MFENTKNIFFLSLSLTTSLYAQQKTETETRAIAQQFLQTVSSLATPLEAPVFTKEVDDLPIFYVYNIADTAYVVVNAQTTGIDILAYVTGEKFVQSEIPADIRRYMSRLAAQIAANKDVKATPAFHEDTAIAPLLSTSFSQYPPFNALLGGGYDDNMEQQLATGCVATAAAQVLYLYQYPQHGTGTFSLNVNGNTLVADLDHTTYQWNAILPHYKDTDDVTSPAVQAVATLVTHLGMAANTQYFPFEEGGSHTQLALMGKALVQHFGYDPSLSYIPRQYISDDEWQRLVYQQLQAGHPVICADYSTSDDTEGAMQGHAFVIDGYHPLCGFHLNWGWGGVSDGYFALSAASSTAPSSDNNAALINIFPAEQTEYHEALYASEHYHLAVEPSLTPFSDDPNPTLITTPHAQLLLSGRLSNFQPQALNTHLGLRLTDTRTHATLDLACSYRDTIDTQRAASSISTTLPFGLIGHYEVQPILLNHLHEWQPVTALPSQPVVNLEIREPDGLYISDTPLILPLTGCNANNLKITLTLKNPTAAPLTHDLTVQFYRGTPESYQSFTNWNVRYAKTTINAGKTLKLTIKKSPLYKEIFTQPGAYFLQVIDNLTGEILADAIPFYLAQ